MRGWREADLAPWAAMNADPEVRRYVGPLLTFEQAAAWVMNYQDDLDRYGFGFWAVEVRTSGEFIGFAGLNTVDEEMPFAGVELGWRLARPFWGHGYTTEGAGEGVRWAFEERGLERLISIIDRDNARSLRVAAKLGFTHWRDMDHPRWPRGVQVYSLRRDAHKIGP